MLVARRAYAAVYEWVGDGYWEVTLAEQPGVHGYGATLIEARRNIHAVMAMLDDPWQRYGEPADDSLELIDDVRLPPEALAVVARARAEREGVRQLRDETRVVLEEVVAATAEATGIIRKAARLLAGHADLMEDEAAKSSSAVDIELPEAISDTIASAHVLVESARRVRTRGTAAQKVVASATRRARGTNREAARCLVDQLGLTSTEAGEFLGLSPDRVEQLVGERNASSA